MTPVLYIRTCVNFHNEISSISLLTSDVNQAPCTFLLRPFSQYYLNSLIDLTSGRKRSKNCSKRWNKLGYAIHSSNCDILSTDWPRKHQWKFIFAHIVSTISINASVYGFSLGSSNTAIWKLQIYRSFLVWNVNEARFVPADWEILNSKAKICSLRQYTVGVLQHGDWLQLSGGRVL